MSHVDYKKRNRQILLIFDSYAYNFNLKGNSNHTNIDKQGF